jgi:exosortase/archaeosortase family protein
LSGNGRIRPRQVVRFGLALAVCGAVVSWSYGHPELYRPLAPLEERTAEATEWLLCRSGIEVERAGSVLSHPAGFAYNLGYRCTGAAVFAFLAVGILVLPLSWRTRRRGLSVGILLVLVTNQARLVSLYYIGVHQPPAVFDFAHRVLWEAAMVGVILAVWLRCLRQGRSSAAGPPGGRSSALPGLEAG